MRDSFQYDVFLSHNAQATRFRIWATQRLRDYIVKGFVLDMNG